MSIVLKAKDIEVAENHKVEDFIYQNGNVAGVIVRDPENKKFKISAQVVIDAGGCNAISIRRLGLKNKMNGEGKIALAAHWKNVRLPQAYCYMHVGKPGYTGMSQVSSDVVNAIMITSSSQIKGQNNTEFYKNGIFQNKKRRELLEGAELAETPRAIESLAFSVKPPKCGGLVLVGDSAGFIDPFTGEGIYLSLRSAQLANQTLSLAFDNSDFSKKTLEGYERARSKEFGDKFTLSRILQKIIYNRRLCNFVVKNLIKKPSLASSLVGVIGDYYPAKDIISVRYLIAFLQSCLAPDKKFLKKIVNLKV